jgi:2-polyprenyl-6-methoxyphenol hydroxylase-like FAD-dependent oxidoreductase
MSRASHDVPVVIAGGGPVGLTLAMDLGWRGVDCLVVEQRHGDPPSPRCNTTNARSMEHFRRLGLARRIRSSGLPVDHPTDVAYVTALTGYELARFPLPSSGEILAQQQPALEGWPTPEPQHRICQIFLEPMLEQHAASFDSVSIRKGWRLEAVEQDDDGVSATVVDALGETRTVRCAYLAGCDGGRSTVRREVGASLQGDPLVGDQRVSIYFRSAALKQLERDPTWVYWWFSEHYRGSLFNLDGRGLFMCQIHVAPGEDPESVDAERVLEAAIGRQVEHETLEVSVWTPRRLVSDALRKGRVLLAGDAAHLWLASGGFGMNAGIGDATALAWRLAAVLGGWGGERLLDDYELERRAIGELTSRAAVAIDKDMYEVGRQPELREEGPEGERMRAEVGRMIERVDRKQWHSPGVQLGLRYRHSPGIAESASRQSAPDLVMIEEYVPSPTPGARLPHYWRRDGRSIFDHLGADFTIIRVGEDAPDTDAFEAAAAALGMPLAVVQATEPEAVALYREALVLVRPDQHIAWTGSLPPEDCQAMLAALTGGASRVTAAHARNENIPRAWA